jgi:hypothetical protein
VARPFRGTTAADRFWANVDRSGDCWRWTGHIGRNNRYGMLRVNGRSVKAHRFSWELHFGPVPSGLVVRHRCDNPVCVRPEHLQLGTQADNVHDAIERGRFQRARDWHGRFNAERAERRTPDSRTAALVRSDFIGILQLTPGGPISIDLDGPEPCTP